MRESDATVSTRSLSERRADSFLRMIAIVGAFSLGRDVPPWTLLLLRSHAEPAHWLNSSLRAAHSCSARSCSLSNTTPALLCIYEHNMPHARSPHRDRNRSRPSYSLTICASARGAVASPRLPTLGRAAPAHIIRAAGALRPRTEASPEATEHARGTHAENRSSSTCGLRLPL